MTTSTSMNLSDIRTIDEQHGRLLETLDSLRHWFQKGKGEIASFGTVSILSQYVKEHFAHEENLMRLSGYPKLTSQLAAHREMEARISKFAEDLIAGRDVTVEILDSLENWLVNHINEEAAAFRQWPGMGHCD